MTRSTNTRRLDGGAFSDVRRTGDVGSLLQFLLATQPIGEVQVVDGCSEIRQHVRSHPLPASRGDDAAWAQSAAAVMEKPQRARSGLKSSPRGPKSPVQSWTAVLNVSADALVGAGGDVSVLSTAVMSRLGIASDDGSWRWIALSFPVVGRFVQRVQLAATPLDSRDPTWSLLGHERWAPRVAATVVADAQRGFLL
ncbi:MULTISPECIES: hypothetical protein [Rhodococcus]|uniref:Uncharacterized protein n=1 Tax=Rhodococcus baikonurensis TaxID=172041 RepID=A0ABV5XQ73_9NOCA|nr:MULTISPECIES: hypothetical protein [Rhodococcus]AZI65546.1 hypothetical protein EHW12_30980 [Rhodococcus sp. NJ-530]MDJ0440337.1 hypothetical protein [Rhodococcus qingshengii]